MGRSEGPVPDGPLKEFAEGLRDLRKTEKLTYRQLSARARYSHSVLSTAASGKVLPTLEATLAYARACNADAAEWARRWNDAAVVLRATDADLLPPEAFRPMAAVGATGEVHLAAEASGRAYAVQAVRPQSARGPVFRGTLAREFAAACEMDGGYGHTVAVADAQARAQAEQLWLASEYLPGPSLAEVVQYQGPLPGPVVLALAVGICEALGTIHAAGVVLRDLKPANVLLTDQGPKAIDFGIAHCLDGTTLTAAGAQVGAAGFIAPEQAEGRETTPGADVFALGCVLAYAATGHAPFGSGASPPVPYRIVYEEPDGDALACEHDQLRELINRCLSREAGERPSLQQIIDECAGFVLAGPGWLPASVAARSTRSGDTATTSTAIFADGTIAVAAIVAWVHESMATNSRPRREGRSSGAGFRRNRVRGRTRGHDDSARRLAVVVIYQGVMS